jgi:uncharacterized protein (TIGR03437 family)
MFAFGGCLKHLAPSLTYRNKPRALRFLTVCLLLSVLAILSSAPLRAGLAARGKRVLHALSTPGAPATVTQPDKSIANSTQDLQQQSCAISNCNATVPTSGQINTAVSFQATATATGCASATAYDWNFGDGTAHSSQQNTTHSYAAAGTYTWTLTTSANTGAININTVAGGLGEGNPALRAPFGVLVAVVRDPLGRGLFLADLLNGISYIRFINTGNAAVTIAGRTVEPGTVRFIAGGGEDRGDNVLGSLADLGSVASITVRKDGNVLYLTNSVDQQLRALNLSSSTITLGSLSIQSGRVSTIPVSGVTFGTGLSGLTVDLNANNDDLYLLDATPGINSVFRITPAGAATRVVGNGAATKNTDPFPGGAATGVPLLNPRALEFDNAGNLYVADTGHGRVIRVSSGVATLVAQFTADRDVPIAPFNNPPYPSGLAFFNNKLYVAMGNGQTVVRIDSVSATPIISGQVTVACDYSTTNCGDGGPIAGALYSLNGSTSPQPVVGIEADPNGLFLLDQGTTQRGRVRFLNLGSGPATFAGTTVNGNNVDTIAGNGLTSPYDGGLASSAFIGTPAGVALDASGNLYLSDVIPGHLRFVNRGTTTVTLFPGTEAQQTVPPGFIVRLNKDAGTSSEGGEVPVNRASFSNPQGLFVTSQGIYVADSTGGPTVPQGQIQNTRRTGVVRFINTTQNNITFYPNSSSPISVPPGNIARIAGKSNEDGGDTGPGNGGSALSAQLIGPSDVAVASDGTLYIADPGNKQVRRINPQTGIITSLSLSAKQFTGLGFDASGRLYITNFDDNQLLRETAAGSGSFTVLASTGLNRPRDVAVDASGVAYVVNSEQSISTPGTNAHRIMRVAADGTVTTFAGTSKGFSGDGGAATSAQLNLAPSPLVINALSSTFTPLGVGIVTSATGDVLFADANNGRVRILSQAKAICTRTGQITIVGQNPAPTLANLNPSSVLSGSGAFTLTLTGTGFVPASVVRWNNSDRPTTYMSATQLTAQIPASDIINAGTAQVTVFNPAPGGGTSNALTFTINAPNPVPTLTGINPSSAVEGSAGFTLTVNGTGFVSGSVVRWDGSARQTTFIDSGRVTAQITSSDLAGVGSTQVTVFNPAPGGGTSNSLSFTIISTNPVPSLTGLNPNQALVGSPNLTLTVAGTNFIPSSVVRWNGSDRATTFVSATQLTAQILASDLATAGTAQVTVFTPTPGGGVSAPQTFNINNPAPTVSGLNPSSANAGSAGITLTVNGTGFINGSVVRWNGNNRTTAFVSATQLTVQIPASDLTSAGTAQVTVFNPAPGGGTSTAVNFTINQAPNPVPAITNLNPNSAVAGSAAFTLTVNGTGFIGGSQVRWNGSDRATTFVSGTQLTAQIPASDIASAGTAQVTVVNPPSSGGGGGTSNAASFTITQPNPAPSITSLNPNSAPAGSPGVTLTVNGTGFINSSVVRWNGADRATTFIDSTRVTAQIPASDVANVGTAQVTVFNPAPVGGSSNAVAFAITQVNPVPTIASLNPNSAVAGGAAFTLTVNGTNFINSSVVGWNGASRPTTFVSATQLTAQIPASDIANAGTAQITVFNPAPGGGTSNGVSFSIVQPNPVPTITSLNPNSVVAGSAGFTLTINGTGFLNTSSVWWNGAERQSTFVNATTLTTQVSAGDVASAGTVSIVVRNPAPGGGSSNAATLTITQPNPVPTITGLNPNSVQAGSAGFTLTITGTGFLNTSSVWWNGAERQTTFVNATTLTIQVPASDVANAGTVAIVVRNPAPGGGSSNAATFTIIQNNPVPALTSLNPSSAVAGGAGFNLTIVGINFVNGSVVKWNGNDRTTTFVSPTQVVAQIPASDIANAGTAQVSVFNPAPGGGFSGTLIFTITQLNPAPTLTGLTPNTALVNSPAFTLTVNGTGFNNSSVVRWNGNNRTTTFVSATQLTAQIPTTDLVSVGTAQVTVFNPAPGGGTSNALSFTIVSTAPVPNLTSLTPNLVVAGGQAFTLTVNGTGFNNSSKIRWEGAEQTTTFVSATQLTAQIPASLIATAGTARITVNNPPPGGGVSNELTLRIARPLANVSAASFLGQMFAPESIVAAFGANLATGVEAANTVPLPTTLQGTTVKVRDGAGFERNAPLFFVAPGQINYLVPQGTAPGQATVTVTSGSGDISVGTLMVSAVAPALFSANSSGQGVAAAVVLRVRANGQQVFEPVARFDQVAGRFVPEPIDLGPAGEQVFLIAFGSGFRGHSAANDAVTATLGGAPLAVGFAGPVTGLVGLDQLNLGPVSRSLAGRGVVDLVVTADGKQSNTVQFSIR